MSKEHKSIKADKKKPAMSPKEKKAAKKAKKATKKSTADLQVNFSQWDAGAIEVKGRFISFPQEAC